MRRCFVSLLVFALAGCGEAVVDPAEGGRLDGGPTRLDGSSRADGAAVARGDGSIPAEGDGGEQDAGAVTREDAGGLGGSGPRGTCGRGGASTDSDFARVDLAESHYLIAAPDSPGPHPLVVSLHGDGAGARSGAMTTWMAAWRPRRDFILVAPEAPTGGPSWRLGDQEASVRFLIQVLNDVARRYDVDVNRVYVQGFSGGSTFLGWFGFLFQDVFAAMALHCGGWSLERDNYDLPAPACRTPARFVIADDDFLQPGARSIHDDLRSLGHEVEWVDPGCSGHCCGDQRRYVAESLAWFLTHTKCDAADTGGCGRLTDVP